jgi:hypothetical protein
MKPRPILKIAGTIVLVVCCFVSSNVFAHTPHTREAHAVIQSIDCQKQVLTLTYPQERGPQKVIWRPDTQFLRDLKSVPATELKEGTPVTVYYHSPFFGKPFATKVVWVNEVKD